MENDDIAEGYDLEEYDQPDELEKPMEMMDVVPQLDEADEYEFIMIGKHYFLYSEITQLVFNLERNFVGRFGFFGDFIPE
jgi:hypothetical protein